MIVNRSSTPIPWWESQIYGPLKHHFGCTTWLVERGPVTHDAVNDSFGLETPPATCPKVADDCLSISDHSKLHSVDLRAIDGHTCSQPKWWLHMVIQCPTQLCLFLWKQMHLQAPVKATEVTDYLLELTRVCSQGSKERWRMDIPGTGSLAKWEDMAMGYKMLQAMEAGFHPACIYGILWIFSHCQPPNMVIW